MSFSLFSGSKRADNPASGETARAAADVPAYDRDRLLGPLYRQLVAGEDLAELLRRFCEKLAAMLELPWVAVARKLDSGVLALKAASRENALWSEYLNLPEHWDGTVVGHGPAALAINGGHASWMGIDHEGFAPWRAIAARERVAAVGAWPLQSGGRTYVIELFAASEEFFRNGAVRRLMERVAHDLQTLLDDGARLAEHRLVASALQQCGNPAFITDVEGEIVWSNRAFSRLYGYAPEEIRGRNPRTLQSGHQGVRYYRDLWSTIRSGQVWRGETVDRDRDGVAYTVRQTITPFGQEGRVTHYLSLHDNVSDDKAREQERELRAGTDAMTGLLTRAAFEAAARQFVASGEPFSVLAASLRGLPDAVAAGDEKSQAAVTDAIAGRLHGALGPGSTATSPRPGEYELLLRGADAGPAGAKAVVERLRAALERPLDEAGGGPPPELRAGTSHFPADGADYLTLRKLADRQLADQPMAPARRRLPGD